jgi:hypothetical protein
MREMQSLRHKRRFNGWGHYDGGFTILISQKQSTYWKIIHFNEPDPAGFHFNEPDTAGLRGVDKTIRPD